MNNSLPYHKMQFYHQEPKGPAGKNQDSVVSPPCFLSFPLRILRALRGKKIPLFFAATVLVTHSAVVVGQTSSLTLRNGDLVNGQLLAIDPPIAVHWQHPDATNAIDFKLDGVAQITFPEPKTAVARSNDACRLLLADGDTLEGSLVSCDHETVVLQTEYAGTLKLPRALMQSLVFLPRSPEVFDGITGLDGWTQGTAAGMTGIESGHWIYRNGAFYADKPASIARDLKLPDVAEIQFDLAWKGGLNLAVALYTDSLLPILLTAKDDAGAFGGFYSLRIINSAFIDLWPIRKKEPVRELGQLFFPGLTGKTRLHMDLRVSKPRHKIALFIDNTPVKEWDDPRGFIGEGTGLRFVQNSAGPLKLSNLRVTQWDGLFGETNPQTNAPTEDMAWPEHGTPAAGTIETIADGKLTIKTANGPAILPLTDLRAIDFVRAPSVPARTEPPTARATFAEGGSFTFVLVRWRPDAMVVRGADFGQATLNPAVFTRLQFLIPEKKTADIRKLVD